MENHENLSISGGEPVVGYLDETAAIDCPYGHVRRVITGGASPVANVHLVEVSEGSPHWHEGYDEVYWVLEGRGRLEMDGKTFELRPGAAAVIPAGLVHAVYAETPALKFLIVGIPGMGVDDPRFAPRKPESEPGKQEQP